MPIDGSIIAIVGGAVSGVVVFIAVYPWLRQWIG